MQLDKEKILLIIQETFRDVQLEDGIGLSEATAIDEYRDEGFRLACRAVDEKLNWRNIPATALNENYTSLSFFDSKGMRFHLPAFMSAELNREYRFGMAFSLSHLSDYTKAQFSLFSKEQRDSVKLFLEYLMEDPDYEFERDTIKSAIQNFWSN